MEDKLLKILEVKVNEIEKNSEKEIEAKKNKIRENTKKVYEDIIRTIVYNFDANGIGINLSINLTMVYGFRINSIKPTKGHNISYSTQLEIDLDELRKMLGEDGVKIEVSKNNCDPYADSGRNKEFYISLTFKDIKDMLEKQKEKQTDVVYRDQEEVKKMGVNDAMDKAYEIALKNTGKFLNGKASEGKRKKEDQ